MKSYNKRKKRLPETSFESEGFTKQLRHEAKTQAAEAGKDLFSQLFGDVFAGTESANGNHAPQHAEKQPGVKKGNESVVFQLFSKPDTNSRAQEGADREYNRKEAGREPGIRYHQEYYESIARSAENFSIKETRELKQQIQQIMVEIRKLASSSTELQVEFGKITVENAPENPGKYYINFFDWLLVMLKQARQKVEDSKAWLDTVKTKSKKKMGYWDKSKKFGTSFSQSNERNAATSTG